MIKKTVIITGASSGIGKATALYFASKGWNVAATMRHPNSNTDFAAYKNIKSYSLDVTDINSMEAAVRAIILDFGAVDVLINNAGYGTVGAFEASTSGQIQDQFAVNVFGLMDLTRLLIPTFRKQGYGHIINVGSMGGRITFPLYSVYHATKWAVDGFSESLMYELWPFNIHVKLIEPGLIKTEFIGRSEKRFTRAGLTVYDDYVDKTLSGFRGAYKLAAPPSVVAKAIFRASINNSGKLRYVVGRPAPLLLALRRILPERIYFALVWFGSK